MCATKLSSIVIQRISIKMKLISHIIESEEEKKEQMEDFDSFFAHISMEVLIEKLRKYERVKHSITDQNIKKFFSDIFMIDLPGDFAFCILSLTSFTFKENGHFFRVRRLTEELRNQIEKRNINDSELWEPPVECAYRGRVNAEGQQYLYVSEANLDICVAEARIEENDDFILINYRNIEPFTVVGIGFDSINQISSAETKDKIKLISDSINRIFLSDEENTYIYSNYIANHFCNFGKEGLSYPSVRSTKGMNICLQLAVKNKLEIHTVLVCRYVPRMSRRYHFFHTFEYTNGTGKYHFDWVREENSESLRIFKKTFINSQELIENDQTTDSDRNKTEIISKFIEKDL